MSRGARRRDARPIAVAGATLAGLVVALMPSSTGSTGSTRDVDVPTDGGRTWHRYATVATFTDELWMGETGMARAANGDLVAVHRTGTPGGANVGPLYTNRSGDDGRTWSRPEPLEIETASGEPAPSTGVMPVLRLLPNGIMTLTFGRPDNWIAISPDGLGRSFEQAQTTYVNHPRVNASFQRFHGSSGNGAHAVVAANRVTVADTDPRGQEFLGELELYSTVNSFENDPVGQVPRGWRTRGSTRWPRRAGCPSRPGSRPCRSG